MDPISHALVGSAIGALAPEAAPGLFWATVAGAVAPDIDFVVRFRRGGDRVYLDLHRGPTHGPPGLLLLAGGSAGLIPLLIPGTPVGAAFLWAALGLISHVLLDLTNAYGTQALWPWRRTRYAWDWTSVVDPVVAGLPLAGWTAVAAGLPRAAVHGAVLVLILLYLALRAWVHRALLRAVRSRYPGAGRVSVIPELVGLNRWRFIAEEPGRYTVGWATWRPLRVEPVRVLERAEDPVIRASRQAPAVQVLLRFARHAHATWQAEPGGRHVVRWTELRYDYGRFGAFTAYAYLDPDLRLLGDKLNGDPPPTFREGLDFLRGRAAGGGTPAAARRSGPSPR